MDHPKQLPVIFVIFSAFFHVAASSSLQVPLEFKLATVGLPKRRDMGAIAPGAGRRPGLTAQNRCKPNLVSRLPA